MLYAKTGCYPVEITIKTRMIGYWTRLVNGNKDKLAFKLYNHMLNTPNFQSKWINKIQNIQTEIGRPDIWQYKNLNLDKNTKDLVNAILKDRYL